MRCPAGSVAGLEPGSLTRVVVDGVPVCLARLETGEVHAISDRCSHEDIELSDGDLVGTEVECPAHGSRFDVTTGTVRGVPAYEPVATYPVTIEDDQIYVEI